jgi:hypothetical protein
MTGSKAPLNLRTLWRYINVYYLLNYLLITGTASHAFYCHCHLPVCHGRERIRVRQTATYGQLTVGPYGSGGLGAEAADKSVSETLTY